MGLWTVQPATHLIAYWSESMTVPFPNYHEQLDYLIKAVREHQSDVCLEWPFCRFANGYGRITFRDNDVWKSTVVHRIAFKVVHDHWPTLLALHHCDNRPCFNPRHIYDGSSKDNMRDCVQRHRQPCGTTSYLHKITEADVIEARRIYSLGRTTFAELGIKYGLTLEAMRSAITGNRWKHLPDPVAGKGLSPKTKNPCPNCGGPLRTRDTVINCRRYCGYEIVLRPRKSRWDKRVEVVAQ